MGVARTKVSSIWRFPDEDTSEWTTLDQTFGSATPAARSSASTAALTNRRKVFAWSMLVVYTATVRSAFWTTQAAVAFAFASSGSSAASPTWPLPSTASTASTRTGTRRPSFTPSDIGMRLMVDALRSWSKTALVGFGCMAAIDSFGGVPVMSSVRVFSEARSPANTLPLRCSRCHSSTTTATPTPLSATLLKKAMVGSVMTRSVWWQSTIHTGVGFRASLVAALTRCRKSARICLLPSSSSTAFSSSTSSSSTSSEAERLHVKLIASTPRRLASRIVGPTRSVRCTTKILIGCPTARRSASRPMSVLPMAMAARTLHMRPLRPFQCRTTRPAVTSCQSRSCRAGAAAAVTGAAVAGAALMAGHGTWKNSKSSGAGSKVL